MLPVCHPLSPAELGLEDPPAEDLTELAEDMTTAEEAADRDVPVLAVYGSLSAGADDAEETARRRNNTAVLSVPEDRVSALMLASSEGKVRLAVVAGERGETPARDMDEPADDGEKALAAADEPAQEPFYFDDFCPERDTHAPAADFQPVHQLANTANSGGIVSVIEDNPEGVFVKYVHTARRLENTGAESAQTIANIIQ